MFAEVYFDNLAQTLCIDQKRFLRFSTLGDFFEQLKQQHSRFSTTVHGFGCPTILGNQQEERQAS